MNINSTAQIRPARRHAFLNWKPYFAILSILVLVGLGLRFTYSAWLDHMEPDVVAVLISFGFFFGAATIYAFGYFLSLPDTLADVPARLDTLRRRWSDFSFLACAIALLITSLSYARVLFEERRFIVFPVGLLIVVTCPWLLSACVVAADRYLGWTLPSSPVAQPEALRSRIRRLVERFGNSLLLIVGRRRALAIGACLVLTSLFTGMIEVGFFSNAPGYVWIGEVVKEWHRRFQPFPGGLLYNAPLFIYVLGLALAACTLVVVFFRCQPSPRLWRILSTLAAVIALFELAEIASQFLGDLDSDFHSPLAWLLGCLLPTCLWLAFVRASDSDRRDRVRLALMVYCLPIFLLGFSFLPFFFYITPGRGFFITGILFLWWGSLQLSQPQPVTGSSRSLP